MCWRQRSWQRLQWGRATKDAGRCMGSRHGGGQVKGAEANFSTLPTATGAGTSCRRPRPNNRSRARANWCSLCDAWAWRELERDSEWSPLSTRGWKEKRKQPMANHTREVGAAMGQVVRVGHPSTAPTDSVVSTHHSMWMMSVYRLSAACRRSSRAATAAHRGTGAGGLSE
jgi:hypothetical protein